MASCRMEKPAILALTVRILIALSTRSFFQPDEYFQSLEPAHYLVFGYGHLTWEWVTPRPLRSIIYPALNVPVYWLLKALAIDEIGWFLISSPRIVHGALAAITDVWICELARNALGARYVSTALFLSLTSFFHALSLSRSLSNSLETSLSTVAFAYYPWSIVGYVAPANIKGRVQKVIFFSALACAVRPTSAVIWVYLFAMLFWRLRSHKRLLAAILLDVVSTVVITTLLIFVVDSWYYRKPTFTPLNFLLTNLSPVSQFYGVNPWHYHIIQSLPILCTTALPFVLYGACTVAWRGPHGLQTMLGCVSWTIGVYSMAGHKEWRFLHPLLPLFHILAAKCLVESCKDAEPTPRPNLINTKTEDNSISRNASLVSRYLPIRTTHLWLLLFPIPASVYVVLCYCDAPISVINYLHHLPPDELRGSIGFLMPCHSTPGQAFLHRKDLALDNRMWALGCEPPLGSANLTIYRDQTDVFYDSPHAYLERHFPSTVNLDFPPSPLPTSIPGAVDTRMDRWEHMWPRYLVFFGALLEEDGVRLMFEERGYKEVWKKDGWDGDVRRRGGVRLWRHSS